MHAKQRTLSAFTLIELLVVIADRAIIASHLGQSGLGWAGGDLNGDGVVDAADLALACPADFNGDGAITVSDIFNYLTAWFAHDLKADANGDNTITVSDIFNFLTHWFGGC